MQEKISRWGGKRICAGRKKTCLKKISFNRRINEKILNILKEYAQKYGITDTEALERAILLQRNTDKKGENSMQIVIPTLDGKLCGHFGHCETFTFVEADEETKEIKSIVEKCPEDGISCQSASWIAEQGANVVLAGGIGGRPLSVLAQCGVEVVTGCPEADIKEIVTLYLNSNLVTGENACGGDHHHCHSHSGEHTCGHHHN